MVSKKQIRHYTKEAPSVYAFRVFNYALLSLLTLACVYPMWYSLVASFSQPEEIMRHSGILLWPKGFSLISYVRVFSNPNIISGYKNTLIVLVAGVAADMIMTSLGAYVLSRRNVLFRKPVMMMITLTMFFNGGLIPTYLNLRDLHLTNNLAALIVPFMISTVNLIILRTSFETIPESLIEAARIDGANHLSIMLKIVLPLSKATLAVMVLYYGVDKWNGWFWASCLIRDRKLLPLQVILREILLTSTASTQTGASGDIEAVSETIKYATIIVATVPILCVYPFLQKYFTKGVMIGAVKE